MRQILQNLKDGTTSVVDVPAPRIGANHLLVHTRTSLVSAGTERMLVDFGRAGLISKARQQPDKVRMVIEKARTDGVLATLDAVRSKLDQPLALGYCNVGTVADVGGSIQGFSPGDRVVSNGKHAEVVAVPRNLCAHIPSNVSDEAASFTVVAAIGLQGIRLANPTLGERVAVIGLGLIGLLTVQLLRAQGCQVLGIDLDPSRLDLARAFGATVVNPAAGEDPLAAAHAFTKGQGIDAVIITASTNSHEPVHQAAQMSRRRGRIVLVGVVGLELSRADFYEKELTFQVSCSYGPGRYDAAYEEGGHDYPIGFVRWTEERNFQAVLDLMASGALNVDPLISHRFEFERARAAFDLLISDQPSLGIVLSYRPDLASQRLKQRSVRLTDGKRSGAATVAVLGAGNYGGRVLIPSFVNAGATLRTVVSSGGINAVYFGTKFGASEASTSVEDSLADPAIDTVIVATRHDAHAHQVLAALRNSKHVFCEKPLCLTLEELTDIAAEARARPKQHLMVGFNRRFAPHVTRMRELLATVPGPRAIVVTVNAGAIPATHWTQDKAVGGGRIVGECCHFVDLVRHLGGAPIAGHHIAVMAAPASISTADNVSITLTLENGTIGTIHYLANGHKGFPKERVEVFTGGRVLQLDNFVRLRGWGWPGFATMALWKQDKGADLCVREFVSAVRAGSSTPIPLDEVIESTRCAIELAEAVQ